jgi:hypothetical protein
MDIHTFFTLDGRLVTSNRGSRLRSWVKSKRATLCTVCMCCPLRCAALVQRWAWLRCVSGVLYNNTEAVKCGSYNGQPSFACWAVICLQGQGQGKSVFLLCFCATHLLLYTLSCCKAGAVLCTAGMYLCTLVDCRPLLLVGTLRSVWCFLL